MNRFLIFVGSVFLALVAVSTATSASTSDWAGAGDSAPRSTVSAGLLGSSFDSF